MSIVEGKRRNGKPNDLGPLSDCAVREYARIVGRPDNVITLGDAMLAYERSADFAELKASTKDDYRYILGISAPPSARTIPTI